MATVTHREGLEVRTIRRLSPKDQAFLEGGLVGKTEATQEGLAEKLETNIPNMSLALKNLVKNEFVDCVSSAVNGKTRKRKVYFLTPKGIQAQKNLGS